MWCLPKGRLKHGFEVGLRYISKGVQSFLRSARDGMLDLRRLGYVRVAQLKGCGRARPDLHAFRVVLQANCRWYMCRVG